MAAALLLSSCARAGGEKMAACQAATDADTAIRACSAVIDAGTAAPKDMAYAHMFRGNALNNKRQPGEAVKDLDEAIRLLPDDANLLADRGVMRSMSGDRAGGIRDLDEALRVDPKNSLALGNRAVYDSQAGQFRDALALLERALAVDKSSPQLWNERCWVRAVLNEDLPGAVEDCDQAAKMVPGDANTYNSRGFAYFRMGKFTESIADYDRSLAGDASVASSWLVRGLAKRAAGVAGAQEDIDKGKALDPNVAARFAGYGVDTH
jgi:tetratricopeptide (TPR) repeat protein